MTCDKKSKKKTKVIVSSDPHSALSHCAFDMPNTTKKDSKILAKDVFEGYKVPKKKCKCRSATDPQGKCPKKK